MTPSALHLPAKGPRRIMKKFMLFTLLGMVYLAASVPVGLFIYSMKSKMGIDVFATTGFHGYMSCLQEQVAIAQKEKGARFRN
jgi:hypothetical protein